MSVRPGPRRSRRASGMRGRVCALQTPPLYTLRLRNRGVKWGFRNRSTMESYSEFTRRFAAVEACLEHLETVRWRNGPYCPHCGGSGRIYRYRDGRRHKCGECRRVFRVVTGTIFANSPLRMLPKWFAAIRLETHDAKGISSIKLSKEIGVTQKTAWHMLKRIRSGGDAELSGGTERSFRRGAAAAPPGTARSR